MKDSHHLRLSVIACVFSGIFGWVGPSPAVELKSPDGNIVVTFDIKDSSSEKGILVYSVKYFDTPVIVDSRLAIRLKDKPALASGFHIVRENQSSHDSNWKPVYGERAIIRDYYNQVVVDLQDTQNPPRQLRITFRAYNEGAAFCYAFPLQDSLTEFVIEAENSWFHFLDDYPVWAVYSAQGRYAAVKLSQVKKGCERPLTIKLGEQLYAALAEARLVDYARMRLQPVPAHPNTLGSQLAGEVKVSAPYTTPWRVIMLGRSPGQLLERNYLILNLNAPNAIKDTSWIKPGKAIREVTLTTEGGKECVDFAVRHGLQYIEYDAGWYGYENDERADATTVTLDPRRSKGPLDLPAVIKYAEQHGIGVWLYVNRRALEKQLDTILPLYHKWGIKGVKYGFVQVGSQQWTSWLHAAIRKAAANKLMVDVHDEYRPTGYSRTYPNFLTMEGIGGNETMPSAEQNLVYPFTRYLCGPADYTICWYSPRNKNTHAHQLAATVVFYSPLQFLFWYDRPRQYQGEPEVEFFKYVPTVWDDTKVIQGQIGQFITIARRHGAEWYVGSMNAVKRRSLEIPLKFLDPDKKYTACLYSDADPTGKAPTKVVMHRMPVDRYTVLSADMAANGGQAIRIVPLEAEQKPKTTTGTNKKN